MARRAKMLFPLVLLMLVIFAFTFLTLLYSLEKLEKDMTEAVNQAFDITNSEAE